MSDSLLVRNVIVNGSGRALFRADVGIKGGKMGTGFTHPRAYGTFPGVIRRYVREKQVLTLEEAVRKMSRLPAKTCGLHGKGPVMEGYDADLTIFDLETISDMATYQNPRQESVGIEWVMVKGKLAYRL